MLDKITSGRKARPRRTVLYGVHGVGKSSWASHWPAPIFIPTEDGIADLDVDSFPLCLDLQSAWDAIMALGTAGSHDYQTVVVDSADWLERLIWRRVCEKEGKKSISDFGYGAGYGKSSTIFSELLNALNCCRDIGMHVVILAHCEIKRFENPEGDSYDKYCPKLHRDTSALMQEWADEVLFATYRTNVRKVEEGGFGKERGIGVGIGERILKTTERPSHMAKNRLGLPEELPLDYATYSQYLPKVVA